MPMKIGDVKSASELGYRGHSPYRYSVCQVCGKERWVRLQDYDRGRSLVCRSCGYPSSNMHQVVKLLKWHIRELENGNPVPMREDSVLPEVRRDYTEGTLDVV